MASEDPRWLAEPGPGEVDIRIAVHPDAELTPELRRAIDDLLKALEEEEVQGYEKPKPCQGYVNCNPDGWCKPKVVRPNCLRYETCRIDSPLNYP